MLQFYQHLPEYLNPIAFSIGDFSIRWYSLMYLVGFAVVYWLLMYRIGRDDYLSKIFNEIPNSKLENSKLKIQNLILDFLLYAFLGLLIGARLGYVLFYNLNYYIQHPLAIISPFENGNFVGIFGMSYFGGLIGIIISSLIFCKIKKINFFEWADFVVPAIPAGYFFGRIGNFLNGELYGKSTDRFWGMYFGDGILRHPTQLYEAFLEGLLLFVILWLFRNKSRFPGHLLAMYLFGYGVIRFFIEFLREQEGATLFRMTTGQILSVIIAIVSIAIFLNVKYPISNVKSNPND